jgi:hypothetical protein
MGDSGFVVSSVLPSAVTFLSSHMSTGNIRSGEVHDRPRGRPATCWLRIYAGEGIHTVILGEHRHNPGISVTNAMETLATTVATTYDLDPATTVWFEHYPPASYTRVRFSRDDAGRFHIPCWDAEGHSNNAVVCHLLHQYRAAQFCCVCSRSKWSRHLTKSPFLALLAIAGSSAACKISSACSNAVSW